MTDVRTVTLVRCYGPSQVRAREQIQMMIRRVAVAVVAAATVALSGCGFYADSTGQTCLIVLGIPICDVAA